MNYHDLSLSLTQALIQARGKERKSQAASRDEAGKPSFTITISREAGALGNTVATEISKRLGWPVYDRNLLDRIAEELGRPASRLQEVDERPASWLEECLAGLFDKYHVGTDMYLKYLIATMRGLGEQGRCVIVGRGANFVLPAESTLRVRLVARPEDRYRVVARRLSMSLAEATSWVIQAEQERRAFTKQRFNTDVADPHHYDLVLNMSSLQVEEAAALIIETLRQFERRDRRPAFLPEATAKSEQTAFA